jgi:peptidoglycan/xylan/chitin deacetylase (PgdA/CDA1 family)
VKQTIIRTGLETLYFSGMHRLMRPLVGGIGCILTLHHVRPSRPDAFQPNRLLEITPEFFEVLLRSLERQNIDVISLDELHRRLMAGDFERRFVCLTFDDGYRDVLQWAYPLLKQYELPFAMFIATSFPDRLGELWWLGLEAAIAQNTRLELVIDGEQRTFECARTAEKGDVWNALYSYLRSMNSDAQVRATVRDLCERHNVDLGAFCRDLCMDWEEIGRMAENPLCTIGAHTVNHPMLKKIADDAAVRAEMEQSRAVLHAALGKAPDHLAYPVGDPTSAGGREFRIAAELGFKTAVTTRPGVLFEEHRGHLTALPRLSVNGEFQQQRYMKVLMSGAGSALWNGFRRVNAA